MIEQNPIQSLFHTYISAGVQASLAHVQAVAYIVPEASRQQAWHILSFALNVPEAWPETRELLLALAPKMEQAGFREEWIPYLKKGLACAQAANDEPAAAECELQIGLLYRLISRFDEATRWTTASVERFAGQGNASGQARALNELAWLGQWQGDYTQAIRHAEQALTLLGHDDTERAMCYRVLGMIALKQGHLAIAEHYHQQALIGFENQGEQRKIAWGLQNLAYTFQEQKNYDKAILLYQRAASVLHAIGDLYHWALVTLNLAIAHLYIGAAELAIQYCVAAQPIFAHLQNKLQLAHIQNNFGLSYLTLADYERAEEAFSTAIALYDSLNEHGWRLNSLDGLGMVYLTTHQNERAIAILEPALATLSELRHISNYSYLYQSISQHLQAAYDSCKRFEEELER